jgi:hypothetical protein
MTALQAGPTSLQQTAAPAASGETRRRRWRNRPTASGARPTSGGCAGNSERTRLNGLARLTGLAAAAGTTGSSGLASSGAAGLLLHVDEDKGPLVVVVPALVQADRLVLALAPDARQAARDDASAEGAATTGRTTGAEPSGRRRPSSPRRGRRGAAARLSRARLARLAWLARLSRRAGRAEEIEVVVRDGILVLLPEEVPLHEDIHACRVGSGLPLEQPDGAHVLLPAEDELFFLLALGLVAPHGHRDGHQDRHHRDRHQQGRHRVACFAVTCLTP